LDFIDEALFIFDCEHMRSCNSSLPGITSKLPRDHLKQNKLLKTIVSTFMDKMRCKYYENRYSAGEIKGAQEKI
jgi:hypothetical protein